MNLTVSQDVVSVWAEKAGKQREVIKKITANLLKHIVFIAINYLIMNLIRCFFKKTKQI